jgi:voltage-gated potassium channel
MNPKLNIIARADFDDGEKKLMRAGANHVVSPHVLGGQRMALASLRPNVVDFMHTTSIGDGELIIEEIAIPESSHLAGKTLVESKLKQDYGINIIGMKKKSSRLTISPGPNTIMEANDVLVIIGSSENLERLSSDL